MTGVNVALGDIARSWRTLDSPSFHGSVLILNLDYGCVVGAADGIGLILDIQKWFSSLDAEYTME